MTLINVFAIEQGDITGFVEAWRARAEVMQTKAGFVSSRLHRALTDSARFQLVNVSVWASQELYEEALADEDFTSRVRAAMSAPGYLVRSYPQMYEVVVALDGRPSETGA